MRKKISIMKSIKKITPLNIKEYREIKKNVARTLTKINSEA